MLIALLLEVALLLILPVANLLSLSGVSCCLFVFSYVGTHFTNPGQSLAKHVLIACVEDLSMHLRRFGVGVKSFFVGFGCGHDSALGYDRMVCVNLCRGCMQPSSSESTDQVLLAMFLFVLRF